jgi:hypothetical protein
MTEQRIHGEVAIFGCNELKTTINKGEDAEWLTISARNSTGNHGQITLFFDPEDRDSVIEKLYIDLGKLIPKH